jgi:D-arabinose 1-dehydrogenase-like Zn-dependent alcohol dehydrogenase
LANSILIRHLQSTVTMPKQAIVQSSIEALEIIETPIPTPKDKEVVIKVVVSGTNPKDWKYPLW